MSGVESSRFLPESETPDAGAPPAGPALDRSVPAMFLRRVETTPGKAAFLPREADGRR